jgi:hypothetical protein
LDSTGEHVFFYSSESYYVSPSEAIRQDPQAFAKHLYRNLRTLSNKMFSLQLFPAFLAPLAVLGLFRSPWDRTRLRGEILLFAALVPPLTFLVFFVLERYYVPLVLSLSIWAGEGVESVGDWLSETLHQIRRGPLTAEARYLARGAVVAVAALALLAVQPRALADASSVHSFRPVHKTVGLWLRDNTPAGSRIMARYPAIPYHAGRTWVPSPHAEYDQILRYMQAQKVDYWVIDDWEIDWRPPIAFLLSSPPPPELELVHRLDTAEGPILVFRVRPQQSPAR